MMHGYNWNNEYSSMTGILMSDICTVSFYCLECSLFATKNKMDQARTDLAMLRVCLYNIPKSGIQLNVDR